MKPSMAWRPWMAAFSCSANPHRPIQATARQPAGGGWDYWVVRTDADGIRLWDQSYGGADFEAAYRVSPLRGGGALLSGVSASSVGGTKTAANYGGTDGWVVGIDAQGNGLWDFTFG